MVGTEGGALIEIDGVRLDYGGGSAVSFALPKLHVGREQAIALLGPSGCGKSTLLNIIAGLVRPTAGSVRVAGEELTRMRGSALDAFRARTIGFVFQTFNLLGPFTALENVQIGMKFSDRIAARERRARAEELLDRVGLSARRHHRPGKLSVGERQRVAIARALANKPALLLADEPTGALDPRTAEAVFGLLIEVCRAERCALVLVTHDLELAGRLPSRFDCHGLMISADARGGVQ